VAWRGVAWRGVAWRGAVLQVAVCFCMSNLHISCLVSAGHRVMVGVVDALSICIAVSAAAAAVSLYFDAVS